MQPFILENTSSAGWLVNSLHWTEKAATKAAQAVHNGRPDVRFRLRKRDERKSEVVKDHNELIFA